MDSYDYLMNNIRDALKASMPLMKARTRKIRINGLYECKITSKFGASSVGKTGICYRPYKFTDRS